ncbi:MAG: gluconate 2-dehydrogenase subunit 3 family protein [Gammaproteobacteria bacterium]
MCPAPPPAAERARALLAARRAAHLSRRDFLRGLVALVAAGGSATPFADIAPHDHGGMDPARFWAVTRAVQAQLFPAGADGPDIAAINATAYLAAVLIDPGVHADERDFVVDGVPLLADFTRQQTGRDFDALDADGRETVLRAIERSPVGQYWLSLMIYYVLEALLADPVYGGNPGGAGWAWLAHDPGFPRPPRGFHATTR